MKGLLGSAPGSASIRPGDARSAPSAPPRKVLLCGWMGCCALPDLVWSIKACLGIIGNMGCLSNIYGLLSCIRNKASRILVVVFWLSRQVLKPIHVMPPFTALLRSLRLEA